MKNYLLVSEGWFKPHIWDMASFCKNACDMAQLKMFGWRLLEADAYVAYTQHVSDD